MNMLRQLLTDRSGTMAIETALVAPVLVLLGVGSFQVGDMVSRQHSLQAAAAEGQQIALAAKPDSQDKLNTIKSILSASTGLAQSNITVSFDYRCGTEATMEGSSPSCGTEPTWTFVRIVLRDTYSPMWTQIGVGSDVDLEVERTVQIS